MAGQEGDRLILAGIALKNAYLAGEPMAPGPFLALIDRKDGMPTAVASLYGPADKLSVAVVNGVLACLLESNGQVTRHYVTFQTLQPEFELPFNSYDAVADNGGSSSDPSGDGDTGGTGGSGSGSSGGSGSGSSGGSGS